MSTASSPRSTPRSGTRGFVQRAVVGLIGVVVVVFFWSRFEGADPSEQAATAPAADSSAPSMSVVDGSAVPAGDDAVLPDGERISLPRVKGKDGVVSVDYAVYPARPAGDDVVTVLAADLTLTVDGRTIEPADEGTTQRRLQSGPAGFQVRFDVDGVEPDDVVDVGVTAADGTTFEFTDVVVDEFLPSVRS